MKFIEPKNITTEFHEIHITIDVPERYAEMVEIHRESENGPGFVQVTSVKMIGPYVGCKENINSNLKGRLP